MPEVLKRKVVMTTHTALPNGQTAIQQATDYVPVPDVDAYVADARTRWQTVEVSTEQEGH